MAQTEFEKTKKSVAVAVVLSMLLPGLGLRYIGRKSEGNFQIAGAAFFLALFYGINYFFSSLNAIPGLIVSYAISMLVFILSSGYYLYCILYAYSKAKEHNHRVEYDKYLGRRKSLKEGMWSKKPE